MTVQTLTAEEKDCIKEALRSHVDFLDAAVAARNRVGGAVNIIAAGLDRLSQEAKGLAASIELAIVISLELPDA